MIHCVFTLDYEIYGDGTGDLAELVYEPADRLRRIFHRRGVRFVNFVEVAEFERIEHAGSDAAIGLVKRQIRELHADGFETGLHLHPQWCSAVYEDGRWVLDRSEYNLCTLSRTRVAEIVDRSLAYLRQLVGDPSFSPLSFRAGNWLFQPTQPAAGVLAERGLRVDSSVFKGGYQHQHGLDYRSAQRNGDYWAFGSDVTAADPEGPMIEVPVFVRMVPFWHMLTTKRLALHNRTRATRRQGGGQPRRIRDFARFRYPLKLDFCRMTIEELTATLESVLRADRAQPSALRPVVAIGHTKDLVDVDTVERFLSFLADRSIAVSTFNELYPRFTTGGRVRPDRPDES